MARYIKSELRCPCCGDLFEAKRLKGWTQTQPGDLDGDPKNSAVFDEMLFCPHCGFADKKMTEEVSSAVKTWVRSDEYQSIVQSEKVPQPLKKWLLAGHIYGYLGDDRQAGDAYLVASWYQKVRKQKDVFSLELAVKHFCKYLEGTMDFDVALVVVDCLRQQGAWREAAETVDSLLPYLTHPKMKAVAEFEQQLIAKGDDEVYGQNEVFA